VAQSLGMAYNKINNYHQGEDSDEDMDEEFTSADAMDYFRRMFEKMMNVDLNQSRGGRFQYPSILFSFVLIFLSSMI